MEILAYGEDALTLWALKDKLSIILHALKDTSALSNCQVFFRPSFGRSGGNTSSQFGEFDFIILAERYLYLGESKWDKSSEHIQEGVIELRSEQTLRHDLFKFYVAEWSFGQYTNWRDFIREGKVKLQSKGIQKPIAPENSLLATNLQTILEIIRKHYPTKPDVKNILLYLYTGMEIKQLPRKAGKDFVVVPIDYSEDVLDNFIRIRM